MFAQNQQNQGSNFFQNQANSLINKVTDQVQGQKPRPKRILSIDGGGIKGLLTLYILNHIEKNYLPPGQTLYDFFDCFAGTSTGSIIAAMLAFGFNTDKVIELYEQNAEAIFPQYTSCSCCLWQCMKNCWYTCRFICGNKYSNAPIAKALNQYLGEKQMQDCKKDLLITACDLKDISSVVFRSHRGHYQQMKVADAILASTAAPLYFRPYQGRYVDGGLWANDPVLAAISEYERDNIEYEVLTVGNIEDSHGVDGSSACFWNAFSGLPQLISMMFQVNQKGTYYYSKFLTQYPKNIHRIVVRVYQGDQSIDNASPEQLQKFKKLAEDQWGLIQQDNQIKSIFQKNAQFNDYKQFNK